MYKCPCCLEEHEKQTISLHENNIFKGVHVDYEANYFYCPRTDESYADEEQLSTNDISMKNAYREKMGLLTSDQIADIRSSYNISQSDLALLLGWGLKTITRYEGHQVQDVAHDTILRKLASDPEWFLQLLRMKKDSLSLSSYEKYLESGTVLFERNHEQYLRSAIKARYARLLHYNEAEGSEKKSLVEEVRTVCNYSDGVERRALAKGRIQEKIASVDRLIAKLSMSLEEACDLMELSIEDYHTFRKCNID